MNIDLKKNTVVITGSSKGIGKNLAFKFALEGANVVINYNKSENLAFMLLDEIKKVNQNCIAVKADVTKNEDVKILLKETLNSFGKVDVLINNAAICNDNLVPMMTETQWKEVIDTNLNSVFLCSRTFSKEMIKRRNGKIINISSLKGQIGSEGQANYSAAKAGVIGFSKALARELGRFNISVNAICPGYIETDLNKKNEKKKLLAKETSLLNVDNYLDDLINFIIYVSSDKFKSVSGQVFNIDSRM